LFNTQHGVFLLAGDPKTVFSNNTAAKGAGDILVFGSATVHMSGALLVGGTAGLSGGSIQLEGNSTTSIVNTVIQGAQALQFGGCAWAVDNASLWVNDSELSGCTAGLDGGGIYVTNTARLALTNSTIAASSAGQGSTASGTRSGGGIAAKKASHVELQSATIYNNTASRQGGGLAVYDNATLVVLGPTKTRITNNKASFQSGGMFLKSANFSPAELRGLLLVYNNTADYSPNIVVAARDITVVDSGDADHVIASDSRDATLMLTFNVSGPHGWPSEEVLWVELLTSQKEVRGTFIANTTTDGHLRKLPTRIKQPPGEFIFTFTAWQWCPWHVLKE
jgi:hypothetical protein